MDVRVEEFEDKGEKDANGLYDYCYKGKYLFFQEADMKVKVRTYSDTPNEASFLSFNDRPFSSDTVHHPFLRTVERHLREMGFTEFKILDGKSGTYEPWRRE